MTEIIAPGALFDLSHATIERLAVRAAEHHYQRLQIDYLQFSAVPAAGVLLYNRACDVIGWALVGSGVAATFNVSDGADPGTVKLGGSMSASANGNAFSLAPGGVRFFHGVFIQPSAGTITGAVLYRRLAKG